MNPRAGRLFTPKPIARDANLPYFPLSILPVLGKHHASLAQLVEQLICNQ